MPNDLRLPDFYIIGAAKAGTTTIHSILARHPDIFMAAKKEPEFFARDEFYAEGIESYARHFADAKRTQVAGEASTLYSMTPMFPETAARIRRHTPEARFIYVMREPVSRSYSHYVQVIKNYQMSTADNSVNRSFEEFIFPERHPGAAPRSRVMAPFDDHLPDIPELFLSPSDYRLQIESYLEYFDRERFLFLKFEDFVRDRRGVLDRITDFLGVAPFSGEDVETDNQNISADFFKMIHEINEVKRIYSKYKIVYWLKNIMPRWARERLRRRIVGSGEVDYGKYMPLAMRPETEAVLRERFTGDLAALSELTGLSFENWR